MNRTGLDEYLTQLRAIPFVKTAAAGRARADGSVPLSLSTPAGKVHLEAVVAKGPLSYAVAEHLAQRVRSLERPGILLVPEVGRDMGRFLRERGALFLDRQGNCHLALGDGFLASVEGRRVEQRTPRGQTAMRAAGYKVLFALLAEPAIASAPLRTLAERAGASRQAASDALARLVTGGILDRHRGTHVWVPHRRQAALEQWLGGYESVLRPALLLGSFRTPERDPRALERRIDAILGGSAGPRWGGCAAGYRLTGHYRGERTVLHLEALTPALRRTLGAVPDPQGPLVVLGIPGPTALAGATPDTLHPLLIYAEMLAEHDDRAREAAAEVAERFLAAPEGTP